MSDMDSARAVWKVDKNTVILVFDPSAPNIFGDGKPLPPPRTGRSPPVSPSRASCHLPAVHLDFTTGDAVENRTAAEHAPRPHPGTRLCTF